MTGFVNLHNHTEFSALDGAQQLDAMCERIAELDQKYAPKTDHGSLAGTFELIAAAKKYGLQPIIGIESYIAPDIPRTHAVPVQFGDKEVSGSGAYGHITLLAQTWEGVQNLQRMHRESWDGFYYKPRIDLALLEKYSAGVIATTGCPSGMPQTYLRMGWDGWAIDYVRDLKDIFGDRLYVEVMDHGLEIERKVRDGLLRISKELQLPLLATNDCHYTRCTDAAGHDALLCLQTGNKVSDDDRMKFTHNPPGLGYHLASEQEMLSVFADIPEAVSNTVRLAESVHYDIPTYGEASNLVRLSETPEDTLRADTWAGAERMYGSPLPQNVRERITYELEELIIPKGYALYFLVTADYVNWAKRNGIIVGPARGSGAASSVAYSLGITGLEPIEMGLPVERFVNPERPSMPDFDVDFEERRRHEVIDYIVARYGEQHVAMLGTVGTFGPRAALKDSARVLGIPFDVTEKIVNSYPQPKAGFDVPLNEIHNPEHKRYAEGAQYRALIDKYQEWESLALFFYGKVRQTGIHPCGVVMSEQPLTDLIPVAWNRSKERWVTECDVYAAERAGLIKFDVLGVKALSIIAHAVENIEKNTGVRIELPHRLAELNDAATLAMLGRGESLGVFQFDSSGMQTLLRHMKPTHFFDLSACAALYRPGPMGVRAHISYCNRKRGSEKQINITPELHDVLAPILDETYGVIVYQEQVMHIAQKLGGYTLGGADILRRIMGKKKPEELAAVLPVFRDAMVERGYSEGAFQTLWDTLVPFAEYSFNKAHTAGYGLVAYWGAYLKCHYPAEYLASQLTTHGGDRDKVQLYLAECERLGIKLVPPSVQNPSADYRGKGKTIYMGMDSIKNVAVNDVAALVELGGVSSVSELESAIQPSKTSLQRLAQVGAFDELYESRGRAIELARLAVVGRKKLALPHKVQGERVSVEPGDERRDNMSYEMQYLGRYVSSHPCDLYPSALRATGSTKISSISKESEYTIAGVVHSVDVKMSRAGKQFAIITLDDKSATMRCLVFPGVWQKYRDLEAGHMIVVHGIFETKDGESSLIVKKIEPLDLTAVGYSRYVVITERSQTQKMIRRLQDVASRFPGCVPVHVALRGGGRRETIMRTSISVSASSACETAMLTVGDELRCNRE